MPNTTRTKKPSNALAVILVISGAILILSSFFWLVKTSLTANSRESNIPTPLVSQQIPFPLVKRVSPQDAKAAFELENATFIDVRGKTFYNEGHLPGALSITEEELTSKVSELNSSSWMILYCT